MSAHWKHGQGFAIRYGGYKDIQWHTNTDIGQRGGGFGSNISADHPVAVALKAVEVGVQILQWLEMRKQTKVMEAGFEERRIGWIVEMLAHFGCEIKEGRLSLDTVIYIEREISRALKAILATEKMDMPSLLLLQLERVLEITVRFNRMIDLVLVKGRPNFILEGESPNFKYLPYWEVIEQSEFLQNYLNASHTARSLMFKTVVGLVSPVGLIGWQVSDYIQTNKDKRLKERECDFAVLRNLGVELMSLSAQIGCLRALPTMIKSYSIEALESGREGEFEIFSRSKKIAG